MRSETKRRVARLEEDEVLRKKEGRIVDNEFDNRCLVVNLLECQFVRTLRQARLRPSCAHSDVILG